MKKIIIVEDDTLLNKILAYNLISDGYKVVSAYSYSMAVSLLKEEYHLALLDVRLPDGSGLDYCSILKEKYPETYIIFLTANDKESDMLKGYEAGGADYITKPFSVAVLCKKIAAVFETIEQHRQVMTYTRTVFSEFISPGISAVSDCGGNFYFSFFTFHFLFLYWQRRSYTLWIVSYHYFFCVGNFFPEIFSEKTFGIYRQLMQDA